MTSSFTSGLVRFLGGSADVGSMAWMADVALKSALLTAAAACVGACLRRRSAATVHRVWTLGFVGCLFVPVIAATAPRWGMAIAEAPLAAEETAAVKASGGLTRTTATNDLLATPASLPEFGHRDHGPNGDAGKTAPATIAEASEPVMSPGDTADTRWGGPNCSDFCIGLWAAGVVLLTARMLVHRMALVRLIGSCGPVDDAAWQHELGEASRRLGVRKSVLLWRHHERMSPLTAGIVRPVIVLPAESDAWSTEQRASVLLHELAHVTRHDVLTQLFARWACILNWFNPICWFGLGQMRRLRELACDDLVISSGQRPTDYAGILLDVARSYPARRLAAAVGMSRGSNVERRILAILDSARNRVPLSRRAALVLLIATAVIVGAVGSMRLETRAEPAKGGVTNAEPAEATNTDSGEGADRADEWTMEVLITDEEGTPLTGARVFRSVWPAKESQRTRFPAASFTTNELGEARIPLPRDIVLLRLWPSQHGYVSQFVNFAEGVHEQGKLIPRTRLFRLARGTTLGGTVIDERGQPIPGVKVDVSVEVDEPAWTTSPDSMISTWLTDSDYNEPSATTDAEGRWTIHNAPALKGGVDYEFRLKFTHDDYVRDSEWGELQQAQGVTTAMLRDGSATIVLSRGKPVTGRIVDADGKPVTKGLVIWSDDPYLGQGVNEKAIDGEGQFATIPLPLGEHPITVAAPGFQPERRMVDVESDMEPLKFKLKPGKRLAMRFVDVQGNGIPHVGVGLAEWQGVKAIYNEDHPNVPNSGIPRQSDENGLYVWDWAPEDAVTFNIWGGGYAATKATLVAREDEHTITLTSQLTFSGKVTDASSGEPIAKFRVIPVIVFRPDFYSVSFQDSAIATDGSYRMPIRTYEPRYRYLMRFEADGYRSAMSEVSRGEKDGLVTEDMALDPATAYEGMVVDPEGNPVEGAVVVVATPSVVPRMQDGTLGSGETFDIIKTGSDGRFQAAATWEPRRIRAYNQFGFAEIERKDPQDQIGTITLQTWARVSGRLVQDGKGVGGQTVFLSRLPDRRLGEARFQDSCQTKTDPDGRFAFERVPPGVVSVRAHLGPWEQSPLTSSLATPFELQPGEHRTLELGAGDIAISGKIVPTGRGGVPLDLAYSLNYLVSRDRGVALPATEPPLGFDGLTAPTLSWAGDPEFNAWRSLRENYFVKLDSEGMMRISGVSEGRYELVLQLYEKPSGCLVQTVGTRVVPIEVTAADVAKGDKVLGDIEVACRLGPRVGENMAAYEFVDDDGRKQAVYDLQGRYVVMHVWDTSCQPCLAAMPDVAQTVQKLAEAPVTFVGLNVDGDKDAARALAKRAAWTWSQNYLGANSEMSRQLALSTTPSYYLIGPDGLLIASSAEWSQIREALTTALGQEAR